MVAQNEARDLIQQALQPDRDYGVIPGTGDKPALLKPGAERILSAFGCFAEPEIIEKEVDHNLEVRWVKSKWIDGGAKPGNWETLKAQGVGRNKKYGQRWVWQVKHDETGTSLGLYRYVVRCRIVHRESGAVIGWGIGSCSSMESKYVDRPRDSENTILKMAKKRAQVDGVLSTFGLSDQFTQDVEDMEPPAAVPHEEPPTPAEPGATKEQDELLDKLVKSHVFTAREKAGIERRIAGGMTKAQAQDAIDWMLATLKERKLAEAAGGNVPPREPREPGSDDDEPTMPPDPREQLRATIGATKPRAGGRAGPATDDQRTELRRLGVALFDDDDPGRAAMLELADDEQLGRTQADLLLRHGQEAEDAFAAAAGTQA